MLLLGFAATSYGVVNIIWSASAGFYFNADPSVGILGNGTGHSTRAQLMYSPDNIKDDIGPSGAGLDNDVIWASVTITEDGVPGNSDDYASFAENYTGTFTAGWVYMLIFQDDVYGSGDWYYYTPMVPLHDITSGFPQIIEMNTDRVNGDAIDFGPNACQTLGGPSVKELTVNGGTGGGLYAEGEQVEISADAPATGKAFSQWIGDTQYVASVTSTTTTVTMPAQAVTLTAMYEDVYYTLTVFGGTGDGLYTNGTQVVIDAESDFVYIPEIPAAIIFAGWIGDTQYVANASLWHTTVTMPATNVVLGSTFKENPYKQWMDRYGLTNYFEDTYADPDCDGLKNWQEYITDTNPTNAASCFKTVHFIHNTVTWSAVSGRVYSVYWTTNLLNGFQCLESNIPWTQVSFTNSTDVPCGYYKIDVRLEN